MQEFDPYSETFFEDPWDVYRWMRDEAPVYHNERLGFWAVSRYDDCLEVLRDARTYTSTYGIRLDQIAQSERGQSWEGVASIITMDPPMHDRVRKLVSRAFTPRRIGAWQPIVERVVAQHLDALKGASSFDVVRDFAAPFPIEVISEILGVPVADRQQIRHWTDAMIEREVGNPVPPASALEASIALERYMRALVADRRLHPVDDMIGDLIEARVEREDGTVEQLDDKECARFILLLASAGAETVTKLLGNGVVEFALNPEQRRLVEADEALGVAAVDEVLRLRPPLQYTCRYSLAERTFHGTTIPARQPVLVVIGAAGRDPRAFDDPDRFDVQRVGPPAPSFGFGIHYCIGAHLGRVEGRTAFGELYRRWPNLNVDLDGVTYVQMSNVAGPASVPVTV